jgi:hypothetical protein
MPSPEQKDERRMSADKTSAKKTWRTGCGYVVASLFFFAGVTGFMALRPVREAKRGEQDLNDRFGEFSSYSPAPDGSVAADRIEAFIAVRERLREPCASFQERRDRMEELSRLEEEGEWSSEDILDGFKAAVGFGPGFLNLMRTRNNALSDVGMGLGEYSYIYVLAYGDQLSSLLEEMSRDRLIKPRTRRELAQILFNQLASPAARGSDGLDGHLRAAVQEEIVALDSGAHAFPWQDGLPPLVEASIAPFEERLDELFCEATVRFELRQKNKNPGGFGD